MGCFTITTLKTLKDYHIPILGYLRISTLTEEDFSKASKEFENTELKIPCVSHEDLLEYLHYQVDLFLLKFYSNAKKLTNEKTQQKLRYLHDRLNHCYPQFFSIEDIHEDSLRPKPISPLKLKKYINALVNAGYPHQILVFGYRNILDGWDIGRVIEELSKETLDTIYIQFINEYSQQSDLPSFVISLCFIRLREKLSERLIDILIKSDTVTALNNKDILECITGLTYLKSYYNKNPEHDISNWCYRIQKKTVKNLAQCFLS
ncbi:MAG: hypothetical protein N2645_06340 [Clostridia bacterium]|nr:hypothetical protein [Clostridia bacterium]